jgi:hypothetical protein
VFLLLLQAEERLRGAEVTTLHDWLKQRLTRTGLSLADCTQARKIVKKNQELMLQKCLLVLDAVQISTSELTPEAVQHCKQQRKARVKSVQSMLTYLDSLELHLKNHEAFQAFAAQPFTLSALPTR